MALASRSNRTLRSGSAEGRILIPTAVKAMSLDLVDLAHAPRPRGDSMTKLPSRVLLSAARADGAGLYRRLRISPASESTTNDERLATTID